MGVSKLQSFFNSYKRVTEQCFSHPHDFLTHSHINCGSCGLNLNLKRKMKEIDK